MVLPKMREEKKGRIKPQKIEEGRQMAESPIFSSICSQPKYLELTPDEVKLMILLIGWSSHIWQNPSNIVMEKNRVRREDIQKLSGKLLAFVQAQTG